MTDENKRANIAQEIARSNESHRAAIALRQLGLHSDALTRLYYAVFHMMTALLLTKGVEPKRHRALRHLLETHVGDVLNEEDLVWVSRAMTYRELADYERAWTPDAEVVRATFEAIDALIARASDHLEGSGWLTPPPDAGK